MKLPYRTNCFIKRDKLTRYLLNVKHLDGGGKAKFFIKMGFSLNRYDLLEKEILNLGKNGTIFEKSINNFGTNCEIRGEINTPSGRKVTIVSIWHVEKGTKQSSLVTAYPLKNLKRGI